MTDEFDPHGGATGPNPGRVPSEWSPPASSLPPPPATAPPASPLTPPSGGSATVSTGPVMAADPRRPRWFGRGVALAAAAALLGGGGYLAVNAGSAEDGADSPRSALHGALDALSSEDLIGAAEFIEPTERETLVEAGFEVVDELIRLDVFGESLDLASIDGVDLAFDDIEIEVTEVRTGLAHLFISSGEVTAAVDGSAVPFGPLVTDRVDADTLAVEKRTTQSVTRTDFPIVAVQRDGRWYLSLWYSVAENARLELGQPLPAPGERINQIGADTPERAIENFVGALEHLDVSTMIGLLDPTEAAALYDYAPLFIDDAQRGADEFVEMMRQDGWSWQVTDLDLRADTDGNQAVVFVDRLEFGANSSDETFDASLTPDRMSVRYESPDLVFDYLVEGDCFTVTFDEGRGRESESFCADELLADFGFGGLSGGAMGGLTGIDDLGIVVRRVDGRWYISPIRTGSEMMLQTLRALDPEVVAETVDAIIDLVNDPFAFQSAFGGTPFGEIDGVVGGGDFIEPVPTTSVAFAEDLPALTEANAHLLADGPEYLFVYDLVDVYRDDLWSQWLTGASVTEFGDGVAGQALLPDDTYVDVLVLDGLVFETDSELAGWLGGEVVSVEGEDGFGYLRTVNSWGDEMILGRSASGLAVVVMYDGISSEAVAALRNQVGR